MSALSALAASALLGRTVRWSGIRLGYASDLVLERTLHEAVGFVVDAPGGRPRFLPMTACESVGETVVPTSPLVLVDGEGLAFYREHGISLAARLGSDVLDQYGDRVATLEDVLLADGGRVEALVLLSESSRLELPPDDLHLGSGNELRWERV